MHLRQKNRAAAVTTPIADVVDQLKDAFEEFIEDTAKPAIEGAREQAAPLLDDARAKAAPVVAAGAAMASEKAERARAAAAEQTGPEPKASKLKRFVWGVAFAGIAGFVAKQLADQRNQASSHVPDRPATRPTQTDPGAASPAEAPPRG